MNLQQVAKQWHSFKQVQEVAKQTAQDQNRIASNSKGNEKKICKFCDWSEFPFEQDPSTLVDKAFVKVHNSTNWHRFNVYLRTHLDIPSISWDEFESLCNEYASKCPYNMDLVDFLSTLDLNSCLLSRSCDWNESDASGSSSISLDSATAGNAGPKCSFVGDQGEVIYVWNAIVSHYGVENFGTNFLSSKWIIFLCGGGYFAVGLFDNALGLPLAHRATHRYTVRKGQGGSQSLKDLSKHCRSAGSSLRRYNETALFTEIVETFNSFSHQADLVFYNATSGNKHALEASKLASIPRSSIPFTTYRATWGEIQRCYHKLTQTA